jgi:proton-dependent oligopeptide transporter, POT family
MSKQRTAFPRVFWVANSIEILERVAYYGIYMGFGIYMTHLGYSKSQLGFVQSLFLLLSYVIPVISGTFADKFGFKKVLIVAYLAYLPSILLLLITKSFSGIALTMLCIGFAAGIFKPLISGTVRVVTDNTNKTYGFGIFYAMINIGGLVGPIIAGKLRVISWNYAFLSSAIAIGLMLLVTILFYKEPPREIEGQTLKNKFRDLGVALSDYKFAIFLVLLGMFFWLPFWAFFNLIGVYIDQSLDTAQLYFSVKHILGTAVADFLSQPDDKGIRHILGESVGNTGIFIIVFQLLVSTATERFRAIPVFITGLLTVVVAYLVLAYSKVSSPAFVFLGIFLFAVGEMMSSPRIQEYITWLAPKEKAGLYMGSNFLATSFGGLFSGMTYTALSGYFIDKGHAEYIWLALSLHVFIGAIAIFAYTKTIGEFKEVEA